MTLRYIPVLCALTLVACGAKEKPVSEATTRPDTVEALDVVATSQIFPPETIIQASVSPKPGFGSWTGHILLLSDTGTVYSTNTAFGEITRIVDGPLDKIVGVAAGEDAPAYFIGLRQNQLLAFAEQDDGSFSALTIEGIDGPISDICSIDPLRENQILITADEITTVYKMTQNERTLVLNANDTATAERCFSDNVFNMSDDTQGSVIRLGNGQLFYETAGSSSAPLTISPGLSINGIEDPVWTFSTTAPMGNTFNKGLVLVRGQSDDRLVMIAGGYLMDKISKASEATNP